MMRRRATFFFDLPNLVPTVYCLFYHTNLICSCIHSLIHASVARISFIHVLHFFIVSYFICTTYKSFSHCAWPKVLTIHFASSGRSHPLITLQSFFFQFPHYLSKPYLVCLLLNSCIFVFTRLKVINMSLLAYLFSAYSSVTILKVIGKTLLSSTFINYYFKSNWHDLFSSIFVDYYFKSNRQDLLSSTFVNYYFKSNWHD